jgi:hypothetical protein
MKAIIMILAAAPAFAAIEPREKEELSVPMELDASTFENDVEGVSDRLRRLRQAGDLPDTCQKIAAAPGLRARGIEKRKEHELQHQPLP